MAKSKKDVFDSAKAQSEAYNEKVSDFKTPFTFQDVIGDVTTGNFTEGALNSSRDELNKKQYNYFKSFDKFNFKYGLEVRPGENGDEDPVVFGFDIIINTQTSPLFGTNDGDNITDFFEFANDNGITEINNRTGVWVEFMQHFSKFFNRTDSDFQNIKSFYLKGVEGLENLVNKATALHGSDKKQFTNYGDERESIKITMLEDVHLNAGHLAMLYNTLAYSKINGKQLIPENLLRFDMSIVVSEIRKFNKVKQALSDGTDVMNIVNDNISRYKYNLYDCQFNFENMSHGDAIKNDGVDITDEYTFNVYYKFCTLEMEKFRLKIGEDDLKTYLNSGNVNPIAGLNGNLSAEPSLTDLPYRSDEHDYIRFDTTQEPGNNVNKFISPTSQLEEISDEDVDGRSDIDKMKEAEANNITGVRDISTDGVSQIDELKADSNLKNGPFGEISNVTKGFGDKLKGAVADIIKDTAQFALQKARGIRDKLINDTLQKIRTGTGLRRISSPINVYQDPSVLNFLKDQIRDFANTSITELIQKSPVGNLPVNDIRVLNEEYNNRVHGGEGGGGISSFDNKDTLL